MVPNVVVGEEGTGKGRVFISQGNLTMSEDISDCHHWGWVEGATGILWVEARDAAEHFIMHRTASHHKELSSQKSIVPKLRNPAITEFCPSSLGPGSFCRRKNRFLWQNYGLRKVIQNPFPYGCLTTNISNSNVDQGSVNYGPQDKTYPLPVFVQLENKNKFYF